MADWTVSDAVHRALETIARPELTFDDDVVQDLIRAGLHRVTAEKLVALVPLAFGRILLAKMGTCHFPDTFVLYTEDNSTVAMPLHDERIFECATEIAITSSAALFFCESHRASGNPTNVLGLLTATGCDPRAPNGVPALARGARARPRDQRSTRRALNAGQRRADIVGRGASSSLKLSERPTSS
jgi:hypothetical protein